MSAPHAASPRHALVVEDDATVAALVVRLLRAEGWSAEVAPTVQAGRAWLARRAFSALLLDLSLPDGSGIELLGLVPALQPALPVLVLTSASAWPSVEAALRAGARGYLLKQDLAHRLGSALRELLAGGAPLSASVSADLLRRTVWPAAAGEPASPADAVAAAPPAARPMLTPREAEILRMLAAGLGYAEIAAVAAISINTVRTHVRAVYDKLGVHNRAAAVRASGR